MKEIPIATIDDFKFNGVIHIGAGAGLYAKYYHGLGIHEVQWFEKNQKLFSEIYDNTKSFGMKQSYHFQELSSESDHVLGKVLTFKDWWRKNAAFVDIDTLDLLHIATKENQRAILEGFSDLIRFPRAVVFTKGVEEGAERYLLQENPHKIFVLREFAGEDCFLFCQRD